VTVQNLRPILGFNNTKILLMFHWQRIFRVNVFSLDCLLIALVGSISFSWMAGLGQIKMNDVINLLCTIYENCGGRNKSKSLQKWRTVRCLIPCELLCVITGSLQQATVSLDYSLKAQARSWHTMHWALVWSIYTYLLAFLQAMSHLTEI